MHKRLSMAATHVGDVSSRRRGSPISISGDAGMTIRHFMPER